MDGTELANYFINLILPMIILLAGLFGNLTGILVHTLRRKQLIKMGPSHIFAYLLISDTVYLHQILTSYTIIGLKIDFQLVQLVSI